MNKELIQNTLLEKNPADFTPTPTELLWLMFRLKSGYLLTKYCATGKYILEMLCC